MDYTIDLQIPGLASSEYNYGNISFKLSETIIDQFALAHIFTKRKLQLINYGT